MTAHTFHPYFARKFTIALLLGILMLAGCEKQANVEIVNAPAELAQGYTLSDLVFAANAPVFNPVETSYVEAVRSEGAWDIHAQGEIKGPCRSEDEIYQAVGELLGTQGTQGEPRIVISAERDTPFAEIRTMVRGAAKAGFGRVDFLVSTASQKRVNHTFPLELPAADGGGPAYDIEPFMVSVDEKGQVLMGLGAGRTMLDSDPEDHTLPKLGSTLELFSAAARAAQCQPYCMVHVDAAARYQRVIDVLSRFNGHQIARIIFTDFTDVLETTCEGMNFGQKERLDLLKIKPLPSGPSSQTRMPNP
jgi:biopolymer transport protein ExbD